MGTSPGIEANRPGHKRANLNHAPHTRGGVNLGKGKKGMPEIRMVKVSDNWKKVFEAFKEVRLHEMKDWPTWTDVEVSERILIERVARLYGLKWDEVNEYIAIDDNQHIYIKKYTDEEMKERKEIGQRLGP